MDGFLQRIAHRKQEDVEAAKRERPLALLKEMPGFQEPPRSLIQALSGALPELPGGTTSQPAAPRPGDAPGGRGGPGAQRPPSRETRIIAEIKKASPSKGMLRPDLQPTDLARTYQEGGAAAISVLTERHFFLGALEFLTQIRGCCSLPLLRKDFILDPYQLYEARAYGADAALLIVALLQLCPQGAPEEQLKELVALCAELGIEPLIEVHSLAELEVALLADSPLIGINNRNLTTFQTDLEVTLRLLREIPPGKLVISESGIQDRADILRLEEAGVTAFLIGETLVRVADPAAKLRELRGDSGSPQGE